MRIIEKEVLYFAPKPIIDVEIGNNITVPAGKWRYNESEVILVGIFYKNKIKQILLKQNKKMFIETVVKELKKLLLENDYLFALNDEMERESLLNLTKHKFPIKDIRKIRGKKTGKDTMFDLLVKHKGIKPVNDIFNGDGSLCMDRWLKFKQTGDESFLLENAEHNINCLLKENQIFLHQDFLKTLYNTDINGWTIKGMEFKDDKA